MRKEGKSGKERSVEVRSYKDYNEVIFARRTTGDKRPDVDDNNREGEKLEEVKGPTNYFWGIVPMVSGADRPWLRALLSIALYPLRELRIFQHRLY